MFKQGIRRLNDVGEIRKLDDDEVLILTTKDNRTGTASKAFPKENSDGLTATCHVQSDPLRRRPETESHTPGASPMGEAAENSRDWRHLTPWSARREGHYQGHY